MVNLFQTFRRLDKASDRKHISEILVTMHEIQFENRHPNDLAIPELHLNMKERVHTLNDNVLTVRTTDTGVGIADYALRGRTGCLCICLAHL